MDKIIKGKIVIVGDNIDTDQIYPGRYLALTDPAEIGSHCLEGVDEKISANFPKDGILVAGRNFGCGSSREHAPIALINMGAKAVVADSFARIFFRNAINLGLVPIVCKGLINKVKEGSELEIDLESALIKDLTNSQEFSCEKLGDQALKILEAGGIKKLMKERGK